VPFKDRKAVAGALKKIYLAPYGELAESALEDFALAWGSKYPMISKSWRAHWNEIIPFLKFSPDIRKAIADSASLTRPMPSNRLITPSRK
jgi:putative transposase